MLTPLQINQLAELVIDSNIDIQNIDAVDEYVGLILEDISGFEYLTNGELAKLQADVLSALKKR